jgi:hypothetical protein
MGFLQDMRDLQQQADGIVAPEHAQYLTLHGRGGAAAIDAVRFTDLTVEDRPVIEFDLVVSLAGAEPYAVTHRQAISRLAMPSFQPGATIPVRVDPADPSSVLLG